MNNETLIFNYSKSLKQKYNAVCFDIDGTLTIPNSKEIDSKVIDMIADLLKRKITVAFITGRGETGLKDLINSIYYKLISNYKISFKDTKRMYALTNDGSRLFYTTENSDNFIFNNSMYISTDNELEQLQLFDKQIISKLSDKLSNSLYKITYSKDSVNDKLLNIRIVFENVNDKLIDLTIDEINNYLVKYNLKDLVITHGVYKKQKVIQIGTTKKEEAIKRLEKFAGVPENSMMRIGDCGDIRGNDYSMLNCEQGYSVDRISESLNSCFPIFDNNGNILKGVDATLFLVKKAKLIPAVCLESADRKKYSYEYAKMESEILNGRNKYLQHYNDIINQKFNTTCGINDLFDMESGSIKIPMYEWLLIEDENPFKQLWDTTYDNNLLYSLRDNNNYLLRGSKTYYYFLANRMSTNGNDYTSNQNVIEWYNNNLEFLKKASYVMKTLVTYNSSTYKMIIGLLDNVRNILLILINHNINATYYDKNLLINLNSHDNESINSMFKLIYLNDSLMSDMMFNESSKEYNYDSIKEMIDMVIDILESDLNSFCLYKQDKDYSKEFRAYREIDNFAENYISTRINVEKNSKNSNFSVCGMCYGGLELSIIYKIIDKKLDDILLLKFNKQVSGYSNKQLVELRKFDINKYGGIEKIGEIHNNNIVLLDDNVLTGKTMQLALNCLYDEGFNITNINIVRYPSINRINQMFMKNHGAIAYHLFFDYITGLCFPSPYSWRDENDYDPYKDSLGIFDLNRRKIIECLIKNHDYKENSEVYEYKGRIKK